MSVIISVKRDLLATRMTVQDAALDMDGSPPGQVAPSLGMTAVVPSVWLELPHKAWCTASVPLLPLPSLSPR